MAVLNPFGQETFYIRYVSQAAQPVPEGNGYVYLWNDTTTGKKWIVGQIGGIVVKEEWN